MPKSPETILRDIHQQSGADQSALYYFSPDYLSLLLCTTTGEHETPKRYWRPLCADVETIQQIRQSDHAFLRKGHPITGTHEEIAAIPILNGGIIGLIVHCFFESTPEDLSVLQNLVHQYRHDLFSGWIEFLVAEQSRPLPALLHIAGVISSSLDLDRVLLSVVEQGTLLFRAKMSSLMLVNYTTEELELVTAYGCSLDYLDKPNLPLHGSILGTAVKANQTLQVINIFEEPLYLHKNLARHEGVCSLLAAPIAFQDQVLGILNIYSATPRRWQRSEMELLQTFADHAAIAITNARVHEQIMAMEEKLQDSAKRATLGELAAGLAHEIRNPLAVINMLIHSWKSSPPNDEDFQHDVNVIAQKISDLNNLVTDLLNLAKNRPLERQLLDMEELVDRVLRLLRHRISMQKVTVKKEILTTEKTIAVDRERIEQAILNLLLNALDVTSTGGIIRIAMYRHEDQLALDIADSGPGIPEDKLRVIFKAFHTNKPQGAGLGLPITQRIVEEHQGTIQVSQNTPEGATFTILLPYQPS